MGTYNHPLQLAARSAWRSWPRIRAASHRVVPAGSASTIKGPSRPIGMQGADFEAGLREPLLSASFYAVESMSSERRFPCHGPSPRSPSPSPTAARFPRRRCAFPHRQAWQGSLDDRDGRPGRATPLVLSLASSGRRIVDALSRTRHRQSTHDRARKWLSLSRVDRDACGCEGALLKIFDGRPDRRDLSFVALGRACCGAVWIDLGGGHEARAGHAAAQTR